MSNSSYWVVFRGKPKKKGPGVITYTPFPSQEDFMAEISSHLETADIVYAGTSEDDAKAAVREHKDIFVEFYACLWEAFDTKTGKFHSQVFKDRVEMIQFLEGETCPTAILVAAKHLLQGRMTEPVPIHQIYRLTSTLPRALGGVLEDA